MSDESTSIQGVTREAIAALLERHNLGALETVTQLDGGTLNGMLLINNALVLRLNLRDPALPKLAKEALIYRRLKNVGVPCPDVLALDTQRDLLPYDALVLSRVEGEPGGKVWAAFDAETQEHLSEELGRLCGSIHSLIWPTYGQLFADSPDHPQSSWWNDILVHKVRRSFAQAQALNIFAPQILDALITTLNDGSAVFDSPSRPTLTHSDRWLWNVLFRQEGTQWHVAAIIDWEWSLVADAAWEFADLWRDPADPYPLPGAFMYGYRERQALPMDLRVRQQLYRLLHHFEKTVGCAMSLGVTAQPTQFFRHATERLLTRRLQ